MADYSALKQEVDSKVYENTEQQITGEKLNSVLNAMVDTINTTKADDSNVVHKTGLEEITGTKVFTDGQDRTVISDNGVYISFPEPEDNPPVSVRLGYYGFEMQIDNEWTEEPEPEIIITIGKEGIKYEKYSGTEWETTIGLGADGSATTRGGTITDLVGTILGLKNEVDGVNAILESI